MKISPPSRSSPFVFSETRKITSIFDVVTKAEWDDEKKQRSGANDVVTRAETAVNSSHNLLRGTEKGSEALKKFLNIVRSGKTMLLNALSGGFLEEWM